MSRRANLHFRWQQPVIFRDKRRLPLKGFQTGIRQSPMQKSQLSWAGPMSNLFKQMSGFKAPDGIAHEHLYVATKCREDPAQHRITEMLPRPFQQERSYNSTAVIGKTLVRPNGLVTAQAGKSICIVTADESSAERRMRFDQPEAEEADIRQRPDAKLAWMKALRDIFPQLDTTRVSNLSYRTKLQATAEEMGHENRSGLGSYSAFDVLDIGGQGRYRNVYRYWHESVTCHNRCHCRDVHRRHQNLGSRRPVHCAEQCIKPGSHGETTNSAAFGIVIELSHVG